MHLEGILVEDTHQDTLLYAGTLTVKITDWFFVRDRIVLKYIGLDNARIYLHRTDSTWNYQFLVNYFGAAPSSSGKPAKRIQLNIHQVDLSNTSIIQRDEWRGEDLIGRLGSMEMDAREISFSRRRVDLRSLILEKPYFQVYQYDGRRPPRNKTLTPPSPAVNDSSLQWNPEEWIVRVDKLGLKDGQFKHDQQTERGVLPYFDGAHIHFTAINGYFSQFKLEKDTISARAGLSVKERSGFIVDSMTANISFHPKAMIFNDLSIKTQKSHVRNFFAMYYDDFLDDMNDFISNVRLDGRFDDASISSDDIAYFAPELSDWKKQIRVSGLGSGTIDNLKGNKLVIEAGQNTFLNGDLSLTGLPYIDKTFITFNARELRTNYTDAVVIVPELKQITQPDLKAIKWLRFSGNFTGFVRDFVTYGTITTNLGSITSDVNMKLPRNAESLYSGSISTNAFDIGAFTATPGIGPITLSAKLNGRGFHFKSLAADLDASIRAFEVNSYTYQHIKARGTLEKKRFNGTIFSDDPNLVFNLDGIVDFNDTVPRFNFEAVVNKADIHAIGFSRKPFDFTGHLALNFEGDDIDNFLGSARVYNASMYSNGNRLSFDSLSLSSQREEDYRTLVLKSNEIDAAIVGRFSIREMPSSVRHFLSKYYPSYVQAPKRISEAEDFSFVVKTQYIDEYVQLLAPGLSGFDNSNFSGRINSAEDQFSVEADVPQFGFNGIRFSGIALKGTGDLNTLNLQSSIGNTAVNDSLYFPETLIAVTSRNDSSDVSVKATSNQSFNSSNISARVITVEEGARVIFNRSGFELNGKSWTIDKGGELALQKRKVNASKLRLYQDQQEITVTSIPSDIHGGSDFKIGLKKINIGDFAPFFITTNRLEGLLDGNVTLSDPFGALTGEADITAREFRLDNDSIGVLKGNANYTASTGKLNYFLESNNKEYTFNISGMADTRDSADTWIDMVADVRDTRIQLLEQYLTGIFSNMEGTVTGKLRIRGQGDNLTYTGPVFLKDALLKIDYTQVEYRVPSAQFEFTESGINFGRFTIYDRYGDSAKVNGELKHRNFGNMSFNVGVTTNRLELLNTFPQDNSLFYGQARGKATLSLTGPQNDMRMQIRGEPTDSSHIFIPASHSREGGSADFIVWKVYGREMNERSRGQFETNITVDLSMTANNLLAIDMILDELTGDVIKATGRGNLDFHVGTKEKLSIVGKYEIERGQYNFSFQTLVRKPFKLREGSGNFVQWNGDPYQANIHIDAEYLAENVRFSDLLSSGTAGVITDNNIRKYRGNVYVVAELRGLLSKPDIAFSFDFPPDMPFRNDFGFTNAIKLIERDRFELNKQVTYLVVFNSFAPFSSSNVDVGASFVEGVVVNTLSGIFSNTLSREFNDILQKIFKDGSLKVNVTTSFYNGSNIILESNSASGRQGLAIDRSNFNLSVGKSILNDRLTFTFGSELDFGLTSVQQAQLDFQFLPDLNAEWKITPDGRVRATFFTRNSYDFYIGRQRNRSGASISLRREFDNFNEILKKKEKKEKKK